MEQMPPTVASQMEVESVATPGHLILEQKVCHTNAMTIISLQVRVFLIPKVVATGTTVCVCFHLVQDVVGSLRK